MAEIDRQAQTHYHMPALLLMERAGDALWRKLQNTVLQSAHPPATKVIVAIGSGNNGGDALVMARLAHQKGYDVHIIAIREPARAPATTQMAICKTLNIPWIDWKSAEPNARQLLRKANWIIDGITGTGTSVALRTTYHGAIAEINASPGRRCAVDIPSGIYEHYQTSDCAIQADITLTVELPKLALFLPLTRPYCGTIETVSMGFPYPLINERTSSALITENQLAQWLPSISRWSYKQQRGVVAVAAGADGTLGAALLAADGATAAGVGLIHMVVDSTHSAAIHHARPSYMVADSAHWNPDPTLTIVAGPGWGATTKRKALLQRYLTSECRGVLDADALHLYRTLSADKKLPLRGKWILTPHLGEFAELTGQPKAQLLPKVIAHLQSMATEIEAVIVLKSATTIIAAPDGELSIYDHPNPALATGGSGDTLAGVIGALLARGVPPLRAAQTGVLLHGLAAQRCYRERGFFLAQHLAGSIAQIVSELQSRSG